MIHMLPLAGERRLVAEPVRPGADFPIIAAAISPDGQRILVSTEQGLALRDMLMPIPCSFNKSV